MDPAIVAFLALIVVLSLAAAGAVICSALRAKDSALERDIAELRRDGASLAARVRRLEPEPAPSTPSVPPVPVGLSRPYQPTTAEIAAAKAAMEQLRARRTIHPPPPTGDEAPETGPSESGRRVPPPSPTRREPAVARWESRMSELAAEARQTMLDRPTGPLEPRDEDEETLPSAPSPPRKPRRDPQAIGRWKELVAVAQESDPGARHCHQAPHCSGDDGPCACPCDGCVRVTALWPQAVRDVT